MQCEKVGVLHRQLTHVRNDLCGRALHLASGVFFVSVVGSGFAAPVLRSHRAVPGPGRERRRDDWDPCSSHPSEYELYVSA